jgi:hypothetical protein
MKEIIKMKSNYLMEESSSEADNKNNEAHNTLISTLPFVQVAEREVITET